MTDNSPWLDTAISGNAAIPSMYTTSSVGKVLHDALGADQRYRFSPLRPASVRGYHHLRSWRLRHGETP